MNGLMLWAQADSPPVLPNLFQWLLVVGDPGSTDGRTWGGLLTWCKVIGLFCLMAWVIGWLFARETRYGVVPSASQKLARSIRIYLTAGVVLAGFLAALLGVLEETQKLRLMAWGGQKPATWIGLASVIILIVVVEWKLWTAILFQGSKFDLLILGLMHLVFAGGYVVAYRLHLFELDFVRRRIIPMEALAQEPDWRLLGAKIGGTYMGLVALIRIGAGVLAEVAMIRFRRLYAIGWQAVIEANRRMWAPWIVFTIFAVILAFTHWFLRGTGDDEGELSRSFVNTLTLLTSILLILMVGIIAPIGMPNDIQAQTIYTVVSKPVRRLEMIWGRLLGYMTLITVLLAIFGGTSLLYLNRNISSRIVALRADAEKYAVDRPDVAKHAAAVADQLDSRMSARLPVYGSLSFVDSKRKEHRKGIDVGQEQEVRSHIEGATPSKAIWHFGVVKDPMNPQRTIDRTIPVSSLLVPGTIEYVEDQLYYYKDLDAAYAQQKPKGMGAAQSVAAEKTRADQIKTLEAEVKTMKDAEIALRRKAVTVPKAEAQQLRDDAAKMHSPPIPVEMTFNIYRTTKGVVGEPVLASMVAINPRPGAKPHRAMFPIREYYTNKQSLPASVLVGSHGQMDIEIRCETPNQYLGMADPDFYVLASEGGFTVNYLKGLFGIWLQALVLTSIGLFAGTFLSWPVALLTTIAFFLFGELAFSFLALFSLQLTGGGPFESLIRLLQNQNMVTPLAPTAGVIVAKTMDALVMPVMGRLVYLVPNFGALDVSNVVAEGFAVTWVRIINLLLLGLGYALPFSISAYFILKNREVAA